jgi:transposase
MPKRVFTIPKQTGLVRGGGGCAWMSAGGTLPSFFAGKGMPAERITMRQIKEVLRLKYACGLSHRQIARALAMSLGAVSKYVSYSAAAGLDWTAVAQLDEAQLEARLFPPPAAASVPRLAPDCAWIHGELKRKGVTLQLLWEEYVEAAAGAQTYRYTQFCYHYQQYVGGLKRSMRQVHRAGEKLFADFAGQSVPIYDAQGGMQPAGHVFVAVLGASCYTFACATSGETMADWIGSLVQALSYFGGVTELVIPDNPRALIAQPDRYEPQPNRTALDFARHYDTVILPARPKKPKDKAKAELMVQVVQRWVLARLRNLRFFSLGELNQTIAPLLEALNGRPFKKLPGSRRECFERLERAALKPLPPSPYEVASFKTCRVGIDYHVEIDGHYYSVPHRLVRARLEARFTRSTVEILHRGARVASHPRSYRRGAHSTLAEHMPAAHRAHMEWTPARLMSWGASIGVCTAALVKHLLTHRPHPEMGYRACLGLLALARQYGQARLEAACTRALSIGSPSRRSVLSILKAGLDRQATPAVEPEPSLPAHSNVRGPDYYH